MVLIALMIVATAYATLGQGGATGYIAVMGLVGFAPETIRPAALALNILVSAIGTAQFARAGWLAWSQAWPLILLGVPCSVLGGATHLPPTLYHPAVGLLLLLAAFQMARSVWTTRGTDVQTQAPPGKLLLILSGAVIGFVAGVTGIGGGILLAPLLLGARWSGVRDAAAASAVFNLLNSAAALLGIWFYHQSFPLPSIWWAAAVMVGGFIGSRLGAKGLPTWFLRYALAVLLVIAGLRMLWT